MPYIDDKIKVDASLKALNEKIKTDIEDTTQKIYWYLKFTLPLDEESISKKTMSVTDTEGYIFNTKIIYNKNLELIIIEPLDYYIENEYYLLHINKGIRAENSGSLKRDIHILFKIKDGKITSFEELSKNIKIPRIKKPPRNYLRNKKPTRVVYAFEKENKDNPFLNLDEDKLPITTIKFNPFVAILGLSLFLIGYLNNIYPITLLGIFGSIIGFIHILKQITSNNFRSDFYYNLGAFKFNKMKYIKSHKLIKKSIRINKNNEFAEFALSKIKKFLIDN